ncbi:ATP-binding protein [Yinghuangia aomiensis]|uniref:ATP-binding protein n=1 Tax=Yinghuangia aomiensis TaxID=676205 RepID=UPI0031E9CAF1
MAEANGARGSGAPRPPEPPADGPPESRPEGALVRHAGSAHRLDVRGVAPVDVSGWDGSEPLLTRPPLLEREGERALVRTLVEELCRHARPRPRTPSRAAAAAAAAAVEAAVPRQHPGDDAQSGERCGQLLIVEGLAGYGKTVLLNEVRRISVENNCMVLSAIGAEREMTRSFSVVRQLFYNLLRTYAPEARAELLGGWFDIIAPAIGLTPAGDGQNPNPLGVRDSLDYLMGGLTQERGPIVLIIDDVQWADLQSLGWLVEFARNNLADLPVLVVVARRTEEQTDADELLSDLGAVEDVLRLTVGTLSPDAVGQIVEQALGRADPQFKARCHEVTAGSPYVLWAMLGEVKRRGLAPTTANMAPLSNIAAGQIGPKLARRLESMGDSTMPVARAIAVLGTDATIARVSQLADVDGDKVSLIADRLRHRAILADQDTLAFVHPLVAKAVYDWIDHGARGTLHARAARLLIQDGLDARFAALHLLMTERCGDPWVVDQLRNAAEQEKRAGAPDAAVRCLKRALAEPPPAEHRAAVRFELGRAAFVKGDLPDSIGHLRGALADDAGDRVLREQIVLLLSRALGYTDQIQEAVELLDSEASAAHASSTKLRLQAEHFLWAVFWTGDPDYSKRARRLRNLVVRMNGANRTERSLLALRAWYGVVRGDPMVQVLASADQAYGPGLTWTDEDWGFEIPSLLALVYMYCDRNDRAEQLFSDGIDELRAHGWQGHHMAYAYSMRGFVRYRQGKLQLAEQDCRHGLRLALRLGPDAPARWYSLGPLIEVLIAQGRAREAQILAEQFAFREPFPSAVVFPDPQAVHGELRLALGREHDAAADFTEAGYKLERRGVDNPAWCAWRVNLAKALTSTDPEKAYEHACEALRRAYRFGAPSAMGQALRVAGRLEGGPNGLAKIEDAAMWLEHSDSRYEYAVSLIEYGMALRRELGDRDAADALFEGLTVAVECGADRLANAAREMLVDMGELVPASHAGLEGGGAEGMR